MSRAIDFTAADPLSGKPLGPGEIHLWLCDAERLHDVRLLTRYHALLAPGELERWQRYKHEPSRHEYLVARALVRTCLSRYRPVDPAAWQFQTNDYGRPEIAVPLGEPRLRFNLSHSRGLVVCAVTWDRDLGVDVETIDRRNAGPLIARRFFAPAEVEQLERSAEEAQRSIFFDFWTLKESYIKARGMGLALPLDQFSFQLADPERITIDFTPPLDDDPSDWQFAQGSPTGRHRLAVALRRRGEDATIRHAWTTPLVD